ncbi:MAG: SdpI family protein [Bacteroidota bacterium]
MKELRVDFVIALLDGAIYVIAGIISAKWPPQDINGWYGYRTPRSMKSREAWDFAQPYSARSMTMWGYVLLALALLIYFLTPSNILGQVVIWILIALAHFMPIIQTELALKNKF